MQNVRNSLGIAMVFAVSGVMAYAQSAADPLRPLVETSAQRLAIAEQVALSKWDSGAAVEDAPREAQVIQGAVQDGKAKGVDETAVSSFFKAQIEANKVVQYSLLADWRRAGKAPAHAPINLASTIRPELDKVQIALVNELAETTAARASASCRADIAKSVGHYLESHQQEARGLRAVALDRALAATCTQ
jgi:chorismate mutase